MFPILSLFSLPAVHTDSKAHKVAYPLVNHAFVHDLLALLLRDHAGGNYYKIQLIAQLGPLG